MPREVPMLTGGGDESGAERMATAVEEVAEPFALFVGHAAKPEPPDAVGQDFEVAETSVVFQGRGIEADKVAAGRSAVGDAFVVELLFVDFLEFFHVVLFVRRAKLASNEMGQQEQEQERRH